MSPTLKRILGHVVTDLVKGLVVGCVLGAARVTPEQLEALLRRSPSGRSRSRTGPPVVFLQRVPAEGARS